MRALDLFCCAVVGASGGFVIYTDASGRPFERPCREDFASAADFAAARYAYKDRVTSCANGAFADAFKKELTKQR